MSEENVEIVRRMSDAFRRGDWAAAIEPLHPEIELDATRSPFADKLGFKRVYRGLDEVTRFWGEWLEAWGEQDWVEELIDAGDQVVMAYTGHRLRGTGSGVEVELPPYAWVQTLRDGKIVRATFYMDKAEALEAAGLSG
jgi:ketosteroid isomerase-like protein